LTLALAPAPWRCWLRLAFTTTRLAAGFQLGMVL